MENFCKKQFDEKKREESKEVNQLNNVDSDLENNVMNVEISDLTKAILKCKSKMSDMFNSLSNIYYDEWQIDLPKDFVDEWYKLDDIMNKIVGETISYKLTDSHYRQL